MVATRGLVGVRPLPERAARVTAPPYDVIKPGTPLEARLFAEPHSLVHVTLGEDPGAAFARLRAEGSLIDDEEPSYWVYEQRWDGGRRVGVLVAIEVTPYEARQVIRHEKTFDDKVQGRMRLAKTTGHTLGPVFGLTRAPLSVLLEQAIAEGTPTYDFATDLGGLNDLHGIHTRAFRVAEGSPLFAQIQAALGKEPVYIADGHHRYHAALRGGQSHTLMYITESARIQAYDRVVRGKISLEEARAKLDLTPVSTFATPKKHRFAIYSKQGVWELSAKEVPSDVVGRLDCKILERELYPHLGLDHSMIADPKHFDYYPESQIDQMKAVVDRGDYELAIALHPVSLEELYAVADAGLSDGNIVMPEKSTFFAPKILTGMFIYRH